VRAQATALVGCQQMSDNNPPAVSRQYGESLPVDHLDQDMPQGEVKLLRVLGAGDRQGAEFS